MGRTEIRIDILNLLSICPEEYDDWNKIEDDQVGAEVDISRAWNEVLELDRTEWNEDISILFFEKLMFLKWQAIG